MPEETMHIVPYVQRVELRGNLLVVYQGTLQIKGQVEILQQSVVELMLPAPRVVDLPP